MTGIQPPWLKSMQLRQAAQPLQGKSGLIPVTHQGQYRPPMAKTVAGGVDPGGPRQAVQCSCLRSQKGPPPLRRPEGRNQQPWACRLVLK